MMAQSQIRNSPIDNRDYSLHKHKGKAISALGGGCHEPEHVLGDSEWMICDGWVGCWLLLCVTVTSSTRLLRGASALKIKIYPR